MFRINYVQHVFDEVEYIEKLANRLPPGVFSGSEFATHIEGLKDSVLKEDV